MGHGAGIRNGVTERVSPVDMDAATEARRTCGPFTAVAAEDATKRRLLHLYHKQCMLTCFIGRLVAKMGSDFLLEALLGLSKDTELQMVVVVSWEPRGPVQIAMIADGGYAFGSAVHCHFDWRLEGLWKKVSSISGQMAE